MGGVVSLSSRASMFDLEFESVDESVSELSPPDVSGNDDVSFKFDCESDSSDATCLFSVSADFDLAAAALSLPLCGIMKYMQVPRNQTPNIMPASIKTTCPGVKGFPTFGSGLISHFGSETEMR